MRRAVWVTVFVCLVWLTRGSVSRAEEAPTMRVLAQTAQTLDVLVTLPAGPEPISRLVAIPWYGETSVQVVRREGVRQATDLAESLAVADAATEQAVLQPVGFLRGVFLARLVVYPAYRAPTGEVYRVHRVYVRLRFPPPQREVTGRAEPMLVEDALRRVVLNPTVPSSWRRPRQLAADPDAPRNGPAERPGSLRLYTSEPGIYVLTREDLAQAGWDVDTLDPRRIHLWLNGTQVPLWVTGQEDGRLDPGDELRFYVPGFHSLYTTEQVWWLTVEDAPGLRWQARATGVPDDAPITEVRTVQVTEFDRVYDSAHKDMRGEHWFWFDLKFVDFEPYPAFDFPFWMDEPASPAQATVTLSLYAYKGNRHDLAFALNGTPMGELHASWNGPRQVTFSLPEQSIRNGLNTLTIRGTDKGAFPDGVYVDRITAVYRRLLRAPDGVLTFTGEEGDHTYQVIMPTKDYVAVLDVSTPLAPVLIYGTYPYDTVVNGERAVRFRATGGPGVRFHLQARSTWRTPRVVPDIPSNLHNPTTGADVIVIAPRAWQDLLAPWVAWKEQQGRRVRVVDVQDVYDEFSYGQVTPEAIRAFLRYAYANWPDPAPLYALLVGDGSYDFKDNLRFSPDNIIPPYLAPVDPWLGETAADAIYGQVSGEDHVPDILVGRWPVGNRDELAVVVQKTLYYERDMPTAEWQRRIVFITDNYLDTNGRPDAAGNFLAQADQTLDNQLGPPFLGERVYYAPWPGQSPATGYYTDVQSMRSAIRLIWNRGSGIMNWIGHASYEQWGAENFLHARELDTIQNAQRLPVLFSITCFTGYFHHPEYPSLDEALLTKADGGIVASWSPTGLAVAYGHQYLQQGFYDALTGGERTLGGLTLAGTLALLAQAEDYAFLPQTYVTLGDPTLTLRLGPTRSVQWLPGAIVNRNELN